MHWELNRENALDYLEWWGDDVLWSWRLEDYSIKKSTLSSQWKWEHDHKKIVMMIYNLITRRDAKS